jgi:hypothetical protein
MAAAAAAALSSLLQNPHTQIHQKQGKPQNKKQKKPTQKNKNKNHFSYKKTIKNRLIIQCPSFTPQNFQQIHENNIISISIIILLIIPCDLVTH